MAQGLLKSNKTRDGIAAVLAENIAYLEDDMYDVQQEWNEQKTTFGQMEDTLEQAGLRILNRPNMINMGKNFWTTRDMPTSAVIADTYTIPAENATAAAETITYTISNEAITSSYKVLQKSSSDYTNVDTSLITVAFAAGAATVTIAARTAHNAAVTVKLWLCTTASTAVPYGNVSRSAGSSYPYLRSIQRGEYPGDDSTDGISCSVVTLTGNDIISELDGTTFDRALQFSVTANSAWGNVEWLLSGNPNTTTKYATGGTVKDYGQISEMTPGETYTLMFWGRIISGDKALARFGYAGSSGSNTPRDDTTNHWSGMSDFVEVTGAGWQRYSWMFTYNPTGDWYTEAVDGNDNTKTVRTYNYFKKIAFGISRKYTGVVQMAGFRMVRGRLWICETYDDLSDALEETQTRASAAEATVEAVQANVQAAICETDSATATANHAVGDVFWMDGVLYKATAAIATGETITPVTNCETTTVEALIAAAVAGVDLSSKADAANPVFTGSISLGRKANTTIGSRSFAVGYNATASGNYSHAEGYKTSTGQDTYGCHAEGYQTEAGQYDEDYAVDMKGCHAEGEGTRAIGIHGSHAEGDSTTASGSAAHAEGVVTLASMTGAHAEGSYTTASGSCAHAEGCYTTANHKSQHVFGEYNVLDDSAAAAFARGNYVEIVGKGTANNARSNARTLDWDGNEALAGSLTLGKGTADEVTITAAQLTDLLALLN